jgi:hypothetical protein
MIKAQILDMIYYDNDGLCTKSIKFLESVILFQTYPDTMKRENDSSLEDVTITIKISEKEEAIKSWIFC